MNVAVNHWAVLVSAVVYFVLGGLWYAPALFGKRWQELTKIPQAEIEEAKAKGMAKTFALSFLTGLLLCYVLAIFFYFMHVEGALEGFNVAALVAVGFVVMSHAPNYLFERKPLALFLINTGYHVTAILVAGAILGAWR